MLKPIITSLLGLILRIFYIFICVLIHLEKFVVIIAGMVVFAIVSVLMYLSQPTKRV